MYVIGYAEKVRQNDSLKPIERAEQVISGYLSCEQGLKFINDKPWADFCNHVGYRQ